MRILLSMLKPFVDLDDVPPEILAERLTLSGLEVSALHTERPDFPGVVVGRVLQVDPHPNADRLSITRVETNAGEPLRIVCGAKNVAPGDVVPVALDGAVLSGGLKIKHSRIRGEVSQGMICSERELGLSPEAAGIMHLSAGAPIGAPLVDVLGPGDTLIDVEVTPNRSDALSHLGVARQIAASMDRPLRVPAVTLETSGPPAANEAAVAIEPGAGCGRYCARILTGLRVAPSPPWLVQALEKLGQRSVNNVLDVTNYALFETAHPLHAFALRRPAGGRVEARRARPGETLTTLDDAARRLDREDLVIADAEGPVALAGVMGGRDSEVTETTADVLLEAAWFDSTTVRRTARRHRCASESSYRFERGVDPENGLVLALDRAAQLLRELAGGEIRPGLLNDYPGRREPKRIAFRLERAERLLGLPLVPSQTAAALSRLGFLVEPDAEHGRFQVHVPAFRPDVDLEEDLVEEVAQMLGYDRIPVRPPLATMESPAENPGRVFRRRCREHAAALGLSEVLTYSFMNPRILDLFRLPGDHPWRRAVALRNPLREEHALMRTALLPGLLDAAVYNLRRGRDRLALFEEGAVFLPRDDDPLPAEPRRFGAVMAGAREPRHWSLGARRAAMDVYDVKGVIEALLIHVLRLAPFGRGAWKWEDEAAPFLHPRRGLRLIGPDRSTLGWAGMVHPEIQERLKVNTPLFAAELDLTACAAVQTGRTQVRGYSKYPASVRDIAVAVPETVRAGDLLAQIRETGGPELVEALPFDLYRGEGLPEGTKSMAFSLTFQAPDRTLEEETLKKRVEGIVARLETAFGASRR